MYTALLTKYDMTIVTMTTVPVENNKMRQHDYVSLRVVFMCLIFKMTLVSMRTLGK